MNLEKIGKIGLWIDGIVLLFIPIYAYIYLLFNWWMPVVMHIVSRVSPVETIVAAIPLSFAFICYYIIVLFVIQESNSPIVIGFIYKAKLRKDWNQIKDLPIPQDFLRA